jgi:subfamily B ATP-binding cassette protein MsbA
LLRFKRALTIALLGALLSAVCFGSGLAMVLPVLNLLLKEKTPLHEWILEQTADGPLAAQGRWISAQLPHDAFKAFVVVILAIAVLAVIGSVGRFIHQLLTITVVQQAAMVWRNRLYRRLIRAPMVMVLQAGHADHMSRIVADTNVMATGFRAVLGKAIAKIFSAVAALIVALICDWRLTMLALISAPLIMVMLRKFGKVIRRASRQALRTRGRMLQSLGESLGGIRVVKVHNAEGYERRRFSRINRELFNEQMKMRRVKAISSPLVELIAMWGIVIVASFAAYYVFESGQETKVFMTVLVALAAAAGSLKPLSSLSNTIYESSAAAARVLEVMSFPVEPTAADDARTARLPRHRRQIVFDHVSFAYPGQKPDALRDVSLTVEHGQMLAIVGPNGSGKTTLLSLLPRIIEPGSGSVTVDGVDVTTVSLRSVRDQIGVVSQQTVLFAGTIAHNIAYGRSWIDMAQVVAAARAAHAEQFIEELPLGYQAVLGEDGSGLSGGQKQRLCIARAILGDPGILILDEATSQIDAESEAQITEALGQIREGRTTFVIAHRLSTVVDADRIVVMDEGRIIDQGTHEQLLDRCGLYRTLTRTQLQPAGS